MFSIVDFKMLKNCSSDDNFVQFVWNYAYSSSFDFGENSTWVSYLPKRNKKMSSGTKPPNIRRFQCNRHEIWQLPLGARKGKKLLIQILFLKQSWFVWLNGLWQKNWLQVEFSVLFIMGFLEHVDMFQVIVFSHWQGLHWLGGDSSRIECEK